MHVLSCYCPHCDANRLVSVTPTEGATSTTDAPEHWWPAVVLQCPEGHPIVRLGVRPGTDEAFDLLLGGKA